jgi:hypothetical protein
MRLFAGSKISSILAPKSGSQGKMKPESDRALPEDDLDLGVHLSMASLILGKRSWSNTLSRMKAGRIGSQASISVTAACGERASQSLLRVRLFARKVNIAEVKGTHFIADRTFGIHVVHIKLSQAVIRRSCCCCSLAAPVTATASAEGRLKAR